MAAGVGVSRIVASYCKQFNFNAHMFGALSRVDNTFRLKHVSFLVQPERKLATNYNLSYIRCASTAVKTEDTPQGCPICSRNLTFTYKDVLLLAQFISPEGHLLNRRVTGVCRKQQRKLERAIEISRRMGLIPRKPPALVEKLNRTAS